LSLIDRILGRTKKTVGEAVDDPQLRREGSIQERKGEAEAELSAKQEGVQDKAEEIADLKRAEREVQQ
jgi:uncharacterized protein YjbJ (UPF0337 family)